MKFLYFDAEAAGIPDGPDFETLNQIARDAARFHRRRCPWADAEELEQEAWVQIIERLAHYDPRQGEFRRFAFQAVMLHLGHHLWRLSLPVHGPRGNEKRAAGAKRAGEALAVASPSRVPPPDVCVAMKRDAERVMALVVELAEDVQYGGAAAAVLLGETTAVAAGATFGARRGAVPGAVRELRGLLAEREELREMLLEDDGWASYAYAAAHTGVVDRDTMVTVGHRYGADDGRHS